MILEGIYYAFQICTGIYFGGFEFYVGGHVCKTIIHVSYYFFFTYYFVDFYEHDILCALALFEKNGFRFFQKFLLSEIRLTLMSLKYFSLVWHSNLTYKFICFLKLSRVHQIFFC